MKDGTTRSEITEAQARRVLALVIGLATAAFAYLAYRKYAGFNTDAGDLTVFGFAFSKTIGGKFFPFFASEGTIMGNHPNFILWLAVPFFWLVPTMGTLFVFQSLLINLAAIPAYLLARDKTGSRLTGLIAAVALLAYPTIASQHVNQIHDDQFGLALLLFAFYFFEKEDFKKFAVCLAASLLAKETITLTTGMFGIWALLGRRNWKWVVFPIGWSVLYLAVVLKGFMAIWQGSGTLLYRFTSSDRFAHFRCLHTFFLVLFWFVLLFRRFVVFWLADAFYSLMREGLKRLAWNRILKQLLNCLQHRQFLGRYQ